MQTPVAGGGFEWQPRTRLLFGSGTLDRLGELAAEFSGSRALLVTDPGIVAAGHVARARASLEAAGLTVAVYDGVRENPTTEDVDACVAAARDAAADLLVGFGGGSSIDAAKGANFLLTGGGVLRDYWGVERRLALHGETLPLIAVSTTAGTGSEVQSHALIADAQTHQKMAIGDPKAAPRVAILDPELTLSQPARVTACTGLDALSHAVESAVTRRRNPVSWLFSREAFRLLCASFGRVLEEPADAQARAGMLLGSAYAGLAIENSMLGAAHSAANPLTAHFGVIHGQAVGTMLPHVVRFNAAVPEARAVYAELAVMACLVEPDAPSGVAAEALADRLALFVTESGLPSHLAASGVTAAAVPDLAAEAAAQWTAQFNPREAHADDFAALYREAL